MIGLLCLMFFRTWNIKMPVASAKAYLTPLLLRFNPSFFGYEPYIFAYITVGFKLLMIL